MEWSPFNIASLQAPDNERAMGSLRIMSIPTENHEKPSVAVPFIDQVSFDELCVNETNQGICREIEEMFL
jgi:hypothetical protein